MRFKHGCYKVFFGNVFLKFKCNINSNTYIISTKSRFIKINPRKSIIRLKINQNYIFISDFPSNTGDFQLEHSFSIIRLHSIDNKIAKLNISYWNNFYPTSFSYDNLSIDQLENLLYSIEEPSIKAKYIMEEFQGLEFAKSKKSKYSINIPFLDLSDEGIVEKYNQTDIQRSPIIMPYFPISKPFQVTETHQIHTNVYLTDTNVLKSHDPILITINKDSILISEFNVIYNRNGKFNIHLKEIVL